MISEKLKPCPVCGHTNPQYEYGIHVICPSCGLSFPTDEEHAAEVWNSLPRKLHWTKEKPTQEGWFWHRRDKRDEVVIIVEIVNILDKLSAVFGKTAYPLDTLPNGEWAGPIPLPMENK